MSRIGKQPIKIPEGIEVKLEGRAIKIKGPLGQLEHFCHPQIKTEIKNKEIIVLPQKKTKKASPFWGLTRALIANMVQGVSEGFEKKLEIQGVGYKATLQDKKLTLNLGFSHPIEIETPEGIEFKVEKNIITVSGIDKQLVGQIAAEIRSKRKPEPYKGKGIRYLGEEVRLKAGKKAAAMEKSETGK